MAYPPKGKDQILTSPTLDINNLTTIMVKHIQKN